VVNAGNTIGQIPFSPQIIEDENILLAAKIWKIRFVDFKSKKIEVIPTKDGKKPMFFGSGGVINPKIREKMFEILFCITNFDVLDEPSYDEIEKLRKDFSVFNIKNTQIERPLLSTERRFQLFTFTGTRINRTIQLLLNIAGIKNTLDENCSGFDIEASKGELLNKWTTLIQPIPEIDLHIADLLETNPSLLDFSKWGIYLPQKFQVKLLKDKYFDIVKAEQFLSLVDLVENNKN
jgi:ATP-dependent Lhr-like helicase